MYDLHTHTVCSDGAAAPRQLALFAKEQGLLGFAVTDHDTMRGVGEAVEAGKKAGLFVLPGAELSAFDPETGRKVHILAYCPQPEALAPLFHRMSEEREQACLRSLALLKSRYPIREEDARAYAAGGPLFRTHLMRALMERGYADRVFGTLYHELFSPGGLAWSRIRYLPMEEAARAVRQAGGVAVLAHPGVYDSFDAAKRLCEKGLLDGIEANYPRRKDGDAEKIAALAEAFSLMQTGGTDFHGFHASPPHPIGTCRTDQKTLFEILELSEKRKHHAV